MPTITKLLEHSRRVCVEGQAFHITGRVAQTALRAYTKHGSREQAFGSFSPVMRLKVTLLVTLGRMNPDPTTRKSLEHSRRVCIEGHALHITGTIVAPAVYLIGLYNFTVREVDYSTKDQPIRARVTTSLLI